MIRIVAAVAAVALAGPALAAADGEAAWDGLVEVRSQKLDEVHLRPQADFRGYTKVLIDPTEVSFRKNWQNEQNRDRRGLGNDVTDADARRILDEAQRSFQRLFADAYTEAGYEVVSAPGPDVLRLSTAIVDLDVVAPDVMEPGRTRTYSREAGEATLVVEAKDSLTGQLLGRAVDERETSDMGPYIRNSVTNMAAFEQVFRRWARASADGLAELKALSPIDPSALQARR
ncbi:MAG TPA: DUF3313 family protein [Croceibacterium sp.]|nr:DUF3313 family protein [Croceibacterium sp.]